MTYSSPVHLVASLLEGLNKARSFWSYIVKSKILKHDLIIFMKEQRAIWRSLVKSIIFLARNETMVDWQGRRKHLKLGGHNTSRARFSLRRRGHVLKMKRALLCLLKNLGGHVPPVPPGSYVSVDWKKEFHGDTNDDPSRWLKIRPLERPKFRI